jgi:hypothetical protein
MFSLTALYGSDFEGGHLSRDGNAADGTPVSVPQYRHEVSLDYTRLELGLQYTIAPAWDVIARVPWEIKDQRAGIAVVESATLEQRAQMQRNVDLHHRTITLRGIGDVMLLGRRRWSSAWREGDSVSVAAGFTVPTGQTIENPYALGEENRQHVHIQFGTGSVDPLLELSYRAPVGFGFSSGAYLAGRFPLYENSHGFHAPPDATVGLHVAHQTAERLQLRLEAAWYRQGYGSWDGLRDENTGLESTSLTAGASYRLPAVTVSADVRYPLSQTTLHEGDAFTQGPTVVLSVGGALRR